VYSIKARWKAPVGELCVYEGTYIYLQLELANKCIVNESSEETVFFGGAKYERRFGNYFLSSHSLHSLIRDVVARGTQNEVNIVVLLFSYRRSFKKSDLIPQFIVVF